MLRIGMTGGIGCGKSTVGRLFEQLGAPVVDADLIAREVVKPGSPLLARVAEAFGEGVLTGDGRLDRGVLRERVFTDPEQRHRLEGMLHPAIRQEMIRRAESATGPYVLLIIPLLLEAGWQDLVDRILVVDCPEAEQLRRAAARDGGEPDRARAIMATQVSRAARLAAADEVVDNSGPLDKLSAQVQDLHRFYSRLAASRE